MDGCRSSGLSCARIEACPAMPRLISHMYDIRAHLLRRQLQGNYLRLVLALETLA